MIRKFLIMATLLISSSVWAQSTIQQILTPSPWAIGIVVAQWLMKDQRKVFYVEVTAEGANPRDAQEQAMRMAVERAVGSVVSTAAESRNSRLVRDEIIVYAAGYVDDYRVVNQRSVGNRSQVQMQVWVGHNKLANRLLGESRAEGSIEGGRISAQIESFQRERQTGDQLLTQVLRDYPQRSFVITMQPTQVWVHTDRETYLTVPFRITWDNNYITSLREVMRSITHRNDCDSFWFECRAATVVHIGRDKTGFDDEGAVKIMWNEMVASRPQLKLTLYDRNNQVKFQECFRLPELESIESLHAWVLNNGNAIIIDPDRRQTANITLPTKQLLMQTLDRAQVEVIRLSQCPNLRR